MDVKQTTMQYCLKCGNEVEKVYQKNECKKCLTPSLKLGIFSINALQGYPMPENQKKYSKPIPKKLLIQSNKLKKMTV